MTILKQLFILAVLVVCAGCSTPKDITYFQDLENGAQLNVPSNAELRLKKGDKLTIVVHSRKPELASQFNLSVSSQRIGYTSLSNGSYLMSSYVVGSDGKLDFPGLGAIDVLGLSRNEVVALVKSKLMEKEYFVDDEDFVVTVEFDNMYFTMLGEVTRQGRYAITKDKLTLFEALGMAGDMSIQGQRVNVKVIRNEGDVEKVYVVDITKGSEIFSSPAYYLHQDDLVYVESNNYKKRQSTVNGNTVRSGSFWLSITSVLSSLYVIFLK